MHAHGNTGRKFGREKDQRRALKRGLMCSLIEYQSITTTLARCKEIRRECERLITKAKKGDLHNRRLIIARLDSVEIANLLVDVIAPQIKRNSGYLRIEHAGFRRGDHAEMGTISFVDDIDLESEEVTARPAKESKPAAKPSRATESDKATKVAKEDK